MKRNHFLLAIVLLFIALWAPVGQAQSCSQLAQGATPPYVLGFKCNFNASSAPFGAFSTAGITYWQVVFVPSGTVASASLSFDSSTTGLIGSWTTGGILSAATIGSMTASGSYGPNSLATIPSNYGQLTPSITGSGTVTVVLYGYTTNPGGGSVSALQAQYPENYVSWTPGTLYPQTLNGTCVFAASTTCTINYPTTFASIPTVNITPLNPGTTTFTVTTSSTSQIVITASASNSLTVNYSATLPAGINCTTQTFALAGARLNADFVVPLWPAGLPANVYGLMRVSVSDTIEIRLCNPTASTITFSGAMPFGAKLFR